MLYRQTSLRACFVAFITSLFIFSVGSAQETPSPNHPPRITGIQFANPQIHTGVDIELVVAAEDPEEDEISFTYQWFINGAEVVDNQTPILPGNQLNRDDRIAVMITPSDGTDTGTTFTTEEFIIPNAPPVLINDKAPAFKDAELEYQVEAKDPDGDALSYALSGAPEGMTIDPQSGKLSWVRKPGTQGSYNIDIIITDNHDGKTTAAFTMILK